MAAAAGGVDYPTLVSRIVDLACERNSLRGRPKQSAKTND
jgi:hypothetical protein